MFLIFALLTQVWAAKPETLRIELVQRTFELTLTDSHLFLRSRNGNFAITRQRCNEAQVLGLWKNAKSELQRFPKIKNGKMRPAAVLDGKRHLLLELRSPASLKYIDHAFYSLQIEEHKLCKRR
jgi:hypothetical protein